MPLFVPLLLLGAAGVGGYMIKKFHDEVKQINEKIEQTAAYIASKDIETKTQVENNMTAFTQTVSKGIKPAFSKLYLELLVNLIDEFSKINNISFILKEHFGTENIGLERLKKDLEDFRRVLLRLSSSNFDLKTDQLALIGNYPMYKVLASSETVAKFGISAFLKETLEDLTNDVVPAFISRIKEKEEQILSSGLENAFNLIEQEKACIENIFNIRMEVSRRFEVAKLCAEKYIELVNKLMRVAITEAESVRKIRKIYGSNPKSYPVQVIERLRATYMFIGACKKSLNLDLLKVIGSEDNSYTEQDFEMDLFNIESELERLKLELLDVSALPPPTNMSLITRIRNRLF